jgi:DNA repair photolyase
MAEKRKTGTREWCDGYTNCIAGCEHNCRYCYGRANAVRFKRPEGENWGEPILREQAVKNPGIKWYEKGKKKNATVMFPTTHDITPPFVDACIEVMQKVLDRGHNLLVVSKPHPECIQKICEKLEPAWEGDRGRILFRFTIGAMDDDILSYWEPSAPKFSERFESLQLAYEFGKGCFKTSISAEPMLDSPNVVKLFRTFEPFVTDTIWIGKMNRIAQRVEAETEEDKRRIQAIEEGQTDERVMEIYNTLKDEPKVAWKDSFKEVIENA